MANPEPETTSGSPDDWGSVDEGRSTSLQSGPAYLRDRHFYRVVAWSLAILAGLALVGALALAAAGMAVPEFAVAIGSTAIDALAGVVVDRR